MMDLKTTQIINNTIVWTDLSNKAIGVSMFTNDDAKIHFISKLIKSFILFFTSWKIRDTFILYRDNWHDVFHVFRINWR